MTQSKAERDYQQGMQDGAARAETFEQILTHSEAAPKGSSVNYATGWRLGFAKVRNRKHRETQTAEAHGCQPGDHDMTLPDDGGRPYDQPYDEHGHLSDKQAYGPDGLIACNDCGKPIFYCRRDENYHHEDRDAECFLTGAW